MRAKDYLNLPERINNIVPVYLEEESKNKNTKQLEKEGYFMELEEGGYSSK